MRKGIILAGGSGTRLRPLTCVVSKQLLPIYDKPMIYYPLSVLLRAGIKEILVISTPRDTPLYEQLLGDGSQWGVRLSYEVQKEPKGLAQAFVIGKKFIGKDSVCLILGDNIFCGNGLDDVLKEAMDSEGPVVIGYQAKDLSGFGVAQVDEKSGAVLSIEEKPERPKGKHAVVGLYFYPNSVVQVVKDIKPSKRGELEITAVNEVYRKRGELKLKELPPGVVWLDTGTVGDLHRAAEVARKASEWQRPLADLNALAAQCGKTKKGESASSPSKSCSQKWLRLLSDKRFYEGKKVVDAADHLPISMGDDRSAFERDYERVIFSSPFRRLAGKTQVESFPEVDFVHNRLTHSVEVAAVARTLAKLIAQFLCARKDVRPEDEEKICWMTQAAGLAHDIGNPPYGHAGEAAIRFWARNLKNKIFPRNKVWRDFECFDGNAQAFRLLCSNNTRNCDFYRFTAASVGSFVKYPCVVSKEMVADESKCKFDVFSTERDLFKKIWKELGLDQGSTYRRHPLSFLSEAADDICYRVLDFEDAIVAGVIEERKVRQIFENALGIFGECDQRGAPKVSIQKLRSRLIRMLVVDFAQCFKDNYETIMQGKVPMGTDLRDLLPDESVSKRFLDEISKLYGILFTEHTKVVNECSAYSQLPLILNRYYSFLTEVFKSNDGTGRKSLPDSKRISSYSRQLIILAWGNVAFYDENRNKDFSWWMHAVLDYVVGMTDSYVNILAGKLKY